MTRQGGINDADGVAFAVASWRRGRAVLERAQGRAHDARSPEPMRGARDRYAS